MKIKKRHEILNELRDAKDKENQTHVHRTGDEYGQV